MRLWRREASTRDQGGYRPPCWVCEHHNVTIASRSFHTFSPDLPDFAGTRDSDLCIDGAESRV